MEMMKDLNAEHERKSPVRTAVKAHANDIQQARARGEPLNAIYRVLKRNGHPVGKGYSSFRSAVRYFDQHGWQNGDSTDGAVAVVPEPRSAVSGAGSAPAPRDRFIDDRNASDF